MGALSVPARKMIIASGFAIAIAAPIGVVAAATPGGTPAYLAQCSGGEEPDGFTTTCVPFMIPKTPGTSTVAAGATGCPAGVSGSECGGQSGGSGPANPMASEAERMATNTEQIGEEVAAATADDA
jgi:hypothetical protein